MSETVISTLTAENAELRAIAETRRLNVIANLEIIANLRDSNDYLLEGKLLQERDEAMKVLDPNMPEQGLIDACRQVKQVAIMHSENSDRIGVLWQKAEAENAGLRRELAEAKDEIQAHKSGQCKWISQGTACICSICRAERERDEARRKLEVARKALTDIIKYSYPHPVQVAEEALKEIDSETKACT